MTLPLTTAIGVPFALAALAIVDGALAGFRAAAGRNGRIDKTAYNWRAGQRGLITSAVGLAAIAALSAVALLTTGHPDARYTALVQAGQRMLWPITPYALIVVISLIAYGLLPPRESSFVIVVGLGPLTLIRPVIAVTGAAFAVTGDSDWLTWVIAAYAVISVIAIEPWVHHRWYAKPT